MEQLMQHEMQALLEALRRDMRNQAMLAHGNTDRELHAYNERRDRHLLELLNPKQ